MKYVLKDKGSVYDLIPNLNDIVKSTDITLELTQEGLDKILIDLKPYITTGGYTKCNEVISIINPYTTEDIIWEDIFGDKLTIDEEPTSIKSQIINKNTATLKPLTFKYLQWNDNLSEMKMFCGDDCIITYERAPGLDCFWMLVVDTINKDGYTSVPLGHYVIKLFEGFIVVSPHTFKKYFNVDCA